MKTTSKYIEKQDCISFQRSSQNPPPPPRMEFWHTEIGSCQRLCLFGGHI